MCVHLIEPNQPLFKLVSNLIKPKRLEYLFTCDEKISKFLTYSSKFACPFGKD